MLKKKVRDFLSRLDEGEGRISNAEDTVNSEKAKFNVFIKQVTSHKQT